jgi:hypothetical protein
LPLVGCSSPTTNSPKPTNDKEPVKKPTGEVG